MKRYDDDVAIRALFGKRAVTMPPAPALQMLSRFWVARCPDCLHEQSWADGRADDPTLLAQWKATQEALGLEVRPRMFRSLWNERPCECAVEEE